MLAPGLLGESEVAGVKMMQRSWWDIQRQYHLKVDVESSR